MTLLGAFGGADRLVPDPCGDGRFAGRAFDGFELGVGESQVDGVGARVAGGGSSAGFLVGHGTDYSVKRKIVDRTGLVLYDKDMAKTTGTQYTEMVRKAAHIGPRTRNHRSGSDLKARLLEDIMTSSQYPGYYSEERSALYAAAFPVALSWGKHVTGYRIDGGLAFRLSQMSVWEFTALLGQMIDAGVQNVGDGERFFFEMRAAA